MPSRKRYNNPFPGKPTKFDLGLNLFMFSPSMMMKLSGMPMRSVITEMCGEAFAKYLERARKSCRFTSRFFQKLLKKLDLAGNDSAFLSDMLAAVQDPAPAMDKIHLLGEWEIFFRGLKAGDPLFKSKPAHNFRIEIERACAQPLKLLLEKKWPQAFELLLADPLMSHYFWPEAIQYLKQITFPQDLSALQIAITLEVELSILAVIDVNYSAGNTSWFSEFLPDVSAPYRNPTALLFQWLKGEVGAESIADFLDNTPLKTLTDNGFLDESKAKRWSCGDHHPDRKIIGEIATTLYPEENGLPLLVRDWAVHNLNMWGYLAQRIADKLETTSNEQKAWPWPNLPFGHASFEAWCQARYPVWLEFHRERQKSQ